MKRLLFIAERFPPDLGGVARSAGRIVQSLQQLGYQIDVLVWSRQLPSGAVESQQFNEAIQVWRLGLHRHWDSNFNLALNVLEWLHQRQGYELVWGHYLVPSGFLAVWFARTMGLKSIVSARGNDVDRGVFGQSDFGQVHWTVQHADCVTAVSRDLARKLNVLFPREIVVLPNSVDTTPFAKRLSAAEKHTLQQELGIADDEVVLGFSGELREKKGQGFLLPALTTVRQQQPACLLVIGEIRATTDAMLEIFAHHHPDDYARLIVTGHHEEPSKVAQYLQLCDVFLLPSLWEGMPNALLEAMAAEVLTLSSDAGGIPEIVQHGQNGLLLARHQLHQLGEAVLEALALTVEQRQSMIDAAQKTVEQRFSLQSERKNLQRLLDEIY